MKAGRYLQRVDRRGFRGYSVLLTRRGILHSRFFADRRFGGRRKARAAAERWRDEQMVTLYPPVRLRRFTPWNRTGVVGVLLERYQVRGRRYRRYRASWPDAEGRSRRRSFDLRKYGEEKAFELAVEARRKGVAELESAMRSRIVADLATRRRRP